jgi:hypothetical protein
VLSFVLDEKTRTRNDDEVALDVVFLSSCCYVLTRVWPSPNSPGTKGQLPCILRVLINASLHGGSHHQSMTSQAPRVFPMQGDGTLLFGLKPGQ